MLLELGWDETGMVPLLSLAECPRLSNWLSAELCAAADPEGFCSNLAKVGAGGLCILSASPQYCLVGLGLDGLSWLTGNMFLCDGASSEMLLAAILFSDIVPVNVQEKTMLQVRLFYYD